MMYVDFFDPLYIGKCLVSHKRSNQSLNRILSFVNFDFFGTNKMAPGVSEDILSLSIMSGFQEKGD